MAFDVAARRHPVDGAAMPGTSEPAPKLGLGAVSDNESLAADLAGLALTRREGDRGDLAPVDRDVDGAVALDGRDPGIDRHLANGVVEFESGGCPAMARQ